MLRRITFFQGLTERRRFIFREPGRTGGTTLVKKKSGSGKGGTKVSSNLRGRSATLGEGGEKGGDAGGAVWGSRGRESGLGVKAGLRRQKRSWPFLFWPMRKIAVSLEVCSNQHLPDQLRSVLRSLRSSGTRKLRQQARRPLAGLWNVERVEPDRFEADRCIAREPVRAPPRIFPPQRRDEPAHRRENLASRQPPTAHVEQATHCVRTVLTQTPPGAPAPSPNP